ncbi:hypothetical protein GPALN_004885 [Globodera pallida]|nr:hypothetical protein GPALN_004885 [Globodera pallida]
MIKVATNENNFDDIERKLLIYALATFLGHLLVASLFLIGIFTDMSDPKIMVMIFIYYSLVMDTGTVVLSSWLLLWASGTFRQQLIKDLAIIRFTNRANIRVGAMEARQNNNHWAVGGAVNHHGRAQIDLESLKDNRKDLKEMKLWRTCGMFSANGHPNARKRSKFFFEIRELEREFSGEEDTTTSENARICAQANLWLMAQDIPRAEFPNQSGGKQKDAKVVGKVALGDNCF